MPKQRNNQNQTISRTPSSYFSSVISNRDDRFNPSVSGRRNDYLLFYFFLFFLFFFFLPPTQTSSPSSVSSAYYGARLHFQAEIFIRRGEPFLCVFPTLRQLLPGFRIHANLVFLCFSLSLSFRGAEATEGIGRIRGKQCCGVGIVGCSIDYTSRPARS